MRPEASVRRRPELAVAGSAFVLSFAVAALIVRPFHVGTAGYDAAASVLYFERISSGRTLEAFVGATPKALLTAVYGLAFSVVPDWRIVSWLAIVAYACGISATATLAHRVAGPVAAGFVAVGLIGSAELLQDVDLAYAVSWALLCWAIAGLLVTAPRPRYAWAGIALAVGGLARAETLIVVMLAGGLIVVGTLIAHRRGLPTLPFRTRVPILLGLLALPIQAAHDWLLTGDPLYAGKVPVLGSAGTPLVGVSGALRFIVGHYAAEPALVLLALVGLAVLVARRRWDVVVGLVALGPGVGAFVLLLAVERIYVSNRYIAPADLAITFAAGIGLADVSVPLLKRATRVARRSTGRALAAALVGGLVAFVIVRPFGPIDLPTRRAIVTNGLVHRDVALVIAPIDAALATLEHARDWPADGSPTGPTGTRAVLLVPILTVPQMAVDLRLPLSTLTGTVATSIATDGSYPRIGQMVFHDVDRDRPAEAFRIFEVDRPTSTGAILVNPILVNANHRFWLDRIDP
jgi:hypothetical protein